MPLFQRKERIRHHSQNLIQNENNSRNTMDLKIKSIQKQNQMKQIKKNNQNNIEQFKTFQNEKPQQFQLSKYIPQNQYYSQKNQQREQSNSDIFYSQIQYSQPQHHQVLIPQYMILKLFSNSKESRLLDNQINNAQSTKLTNLNSQQPHQFLNLLEDYNHKLEKQDFSVLFKDYQIIKLIYFIADSRYLLPTTTRQTVKQFLDLVNSRIQYFPFAQTLYKQFLTACQRLSMAYQYIGSRRNVSIAENQRNRIYQHLVQETETKPRRQAIYYVELKSQNKRISLGQYMAQNPQFFKDRKWRQIMDIVRRQIQKTSLQEVRHDNQQIIKILKKMDYSNKIYNKIALNMSCIGCCDFFIVNWNIFDQNVNRGTLAIGGKILDMISKKTTVENKQNIIKKTIQQVCALLNSGGGVILYNCETLYMSVIPRGQFLTQEQGKQVERKIKEQISQRIYPKIDFGTDIEVSFLRMLKDPIMQEKQYDINNIPAEMFLDNLFMVRVLVRPKLKATYYYEEQGQFYQAYRYRSISETQIECIKLENKPTQVEKPKDRQDWISGIVNSPYSQFDHEKCKCSKYCLKAQQLPVKKQPQEQISGDNEKKFKYATAMVVKKQNFQEFKNRLIKLDFQHYCEFPFLNSKVKGANATVILYHSKQSNFITDMINHSSEFMFNGRNTVTVGITDHIKLVNRLNRNILPYDQFQNLQLWIDQEFKDVKCKLQMCAYKNQFSEDEYYLRIIGQKAIKKCTLYVYLVSNHFGERAQLRSPKNPQKLIIYNYKIK